MDPTPLFDQAFEGGTIVVVPSLSFDLAELAKITGFQYYEERLLFMALLAGRADTRVVYLTALPIDPEVIRYYLSFAPDPAAAASRFEAIALDDASERPLTAKILDRPDVCDRIRTEASGQGYVLPFNVTELEGRLEQKLGLEIFGPRPEQAFYGTKTGSRRVAKEAGVEVLQGAEGLCSLDEIEVAIHRLDDAVETVVVKINDGFSGQGNAILQRSRVTSPLDDSEVIFCGEGESWPSYARKVERIGAIVERLAQDPQLRSPSAQLQITRDGRPAVLSTHDQVLGGAHDQVYLGCRFPADPAYRLHIQEAGRAVAGVLADAGVIGPFGIDFVVLPEEGVYLSEINLRLGGTTHPFCMAKLICDGVYDARTGDLVAADGRRKYYRSSDNLKGPTLHGRDAASVIEQVGKAGLLFDRDTRRGVTLHMFGPLGEYGKMGAMCIDDSPEAASELYARLLGLLGVGPG